MPHFLTTIQLPDDFDPSTQDPAVGRDMEALGQEMMAAGLNVIYACGLHPAVTAKTLRFQPDGEVLVIDGPYVEAKEHVGGFSILECADMEEAVSWASKGAKACRASGEVREIFFQPPPAE